MHVFLSKKAEKKYGKQGDLSQIDVDSMKNRTNESSGSSDEESGDNESNDDRDLERSSKVEDDTTEQDDLLVLKTRHVNFDPGPSPREVSLKHNIHPNLT